MVALLMCVKVVLHFRFITKYLYSTKVPSVQKADPRASERLKLDEANTNISEQETTT